MKIETVNKDQLIIDRLKRVILQFEDNCEVSLDQIKEYDIDLDKCEYGLIELTNAFIEQEIINRYKRENGKIKFIHIEGSCVSKEDYEKVETFMWDIPCNLVIRKLRISSDGTNVGDMVVLLEGDVR